MKPPLAGPILPALLRLAPMAGYGLATAGAVYFTVWSVPKAAGS